MMRNNRFRDDLRDKYLFPQLKLPRTVIWSLANNKQTMEILSNTWHFFVDPFSERTDPRKHSEIFSSAHAMTPADSSSENPFSVLLTDIRPTAISLATTSLVCYSTSAADHGFLVHRCQRPVNSRTFMGILHRKHCLLQCVCSVSTSNSTTPSYIKLSAESI